jgi:FkbM family methyltransferase
MQFYGQCQEDKFLYERFFQRYKLEGQKYYLEMGALNGVLYSNTKFFEDSLKWTGILVEGNPFVFHHLIVNRPKNKLINVVCSDEKESLKFNVCLKQPAVSSLQITQPKGFDESYYKKSGTIEINSIPVSLDTIITNSGLPRIDLLVLDVEGHELNVLQSFSFQIPVVLWLIEFLDEDANEKIKTLMQENNCTYMGECAHNSIFIHNDYLQYFDLDQ